MLVLSDILLALLIWGVAYVLQSVWGRGELTGLSVATVASVIVAWVGLRALLGLYPGYGLDPVEELRRHTYAVLATLAALAIFALGFQVGALLSRPLLALLFLGLLLLAPFTRYFVKRGMKEVGLWGKPVVILSYKETGTNIASNLEQSWGLGYDPVAVFNYRLDAGESPFESVDHHQVLAGAVDLAREQGVDTVIFAMPHMRRENLAVLASQASVSFRHVMIIPNLGGITNSAVVARDFGGTFGVEIKHNLLDPWSRRIKRMLDLFGAIVGGLLISPLLATIVILIKLDSSGPVFYGHQRLGAEDEHFRCWKFCTMHLNAERLLDEYLQGDPKLRAEWEHSQKLRNDPRVTRVGRFLRKTSLDELPQLWNVLLGEMSLIGPRPIVDAEVAKYGEVYGLYKRIRPGISGYWQVGGRSDTSYVERVAMDSYYVRNWSVWLDLVILGRTVKIVTLSRGAY
jgi:Undecaprenyl-phosphate galactose phosphotransferase WbaP